MHISAAEANDSAFLAKMDSVEISVLTCQPHDQVYSLYGHTALRIHDLRTGKDVAVNFGVFDTTKDYFVVRFVFGLTDYMMAMYDFTDFLAEYRYYGSGVYQQRLNLDARQKANVLMILAENAKPENVVYRYNFYYNNCTTRIRDVIFEAVGYTDSPMTEQPLKDTFRDLIHEKNEEHPWARFGNDILLGVGSDFVATYRESEFIPDRMMKHLEQMELDRDRLDGKPRPMVDTAYWVLQPGVPYHSDEPDFPLMPWQCAMVLLCAILAFVVIERYVVGKPLLWMTYVVSVLFGLLGLLLLMMVFSKHPTVRVNLQIFIFNPMLLVLAFPKLRWKYCWHVVLACCIAFFLGNAIQCYAEGMNVLALGLTIIALNRLFPVKVASSNA